MINDNVCQFVYKDFQVVSMKSKSLYFVLRAYANNSIHLNSKQRNYATLSLIFLDVPKLAIVYHSPLSLQFNVTDKLQTIIGIFSRLNPETRKTPGENIIEPTNNEKPYNQPQSNWSKELCI